MSVRKLLAWVFGAVLFALLARSLLVAASMRRIHAEARRTADAGHADLEAVATANALAVDLETGIRGFVLLRDPAFREPYDQALLRQESVLAALRERLETVPEAAPLGSKLTTALDEWNRLVAAPLLRADPATDARLLHLDGKRRMDAIRALLADAQRTLGVAQRARLDKLEHARAGVLEAYTVSTALFLAIVALSWFVVRRTIERPLAALVEYSNDSTAREPPALKGAAEVLELGRALAAMRVRLEEKARELEATLRSLAEGVFAFDEKQVCRATNPAGRELLGRDIVGRDIAELRKILETSIPEGPAVPVGGGEIDGVSATRGAVRRVVDANGQTRIISINTVPMPAPYKGMVASARDVTAEHQLREQLAALNEELQAQNEELTAQEEELRAQSEELAQHNAALIDASRAKTEFLATMSHELRTPLNAVIGFSEMLLEGTYGSVSERQIGALTDVYKAGRHLLALIDDLLDLAKVEAGRVDLAIVSVDVGAVIAEATSLVATAAAAKPLALESYVSSGIFVRGDRSRLRQVIVNLLSNAVKFTPIDGRVTIHAERLGERVRIEVRDTGIGIRAEDASKLFQPFSQVETGDRRRFGGTGLGLSISKRLIDLMHGEIGFSSEPSVGSTFFVELQAAGPGAPEKTSGTAGRRDATPTVLVVEDVMTDAAIVETSLTNHGYLVRVVGDAERALVALEASPPSLLIVDLALPGMSGRALIDRLRADPRFAWLPIAVLSGRDLEGEERARLTSKVQLVARKGIASRAEFLAQLAELVPPGPPPAQRKLVLVVDDNDVNRRVALAMVESLGYDGLDASDAAGALRIAHERKPDVILMDIQMPGMDGMAATRALRESRETAKIPVVAVTAHAMLGDAERFLAAGCVGYVAKPIGRARLAEAISQALKRDG